MASLACSIRHLLACALAAGSAPAMAAEQPAVVGWIEQVRLGTEGLLVSAKLDTGADTSSLHARDIRWSKRDDGDWVGFDVMNGKGERLHFERKVVRIVRIRRAGDASQRRPVVMMGICLGGVYRRTEVNLVDRSRMSHGLLVGRRFLAGYFAVDSGRTNTIDPACDAARLQ